MSTLHGGEWLKPNRSLVISATTLVWVAMAATVLGGAVEDSPPKFQAGTATSAAVSGITVRYFVIEEGVYTVAMNGVKMEAAKFTSTVTDYRRSWNGQTRSYSNSYSAPVVLGQVMTCNDPDWSVFRCRGSSRDRPPNQQVGYIVFE